MIHFIGTSYAAVTLKETARRRGLKLTDDVDKAELIFVSEDTPTDEDGNRNVEPIEKLVYHCPPKTPLVLTSQVSPGFTRKLLHRNFGVLYHQAETLRIEDGIQRAMYPEMFIVGSDYPMNRPHQAYEDYLKSFDCPVLMMTYEEAEFAKIAINMTLISQIENTNKLAKKAREYGANWSKIAQVLRHDSRIGKYSYLTPGDWRQSKHLLRDYVTFNQ